MRISAAMLDNIRLRISEDEKRAILAAAAKRGLSLSEYIRETTTEAARGAAA